MLAKMDEKQAYHNVAVHSKDSYLLRMVWDGHIFVDTRLPFGIFTAIADTLQWMNRKA